MKRVLLCIGLAVLLVGCSAEAQPETQNATEARAIPAVEPTEPAGTLKPEDPVSAQTAGSVLAYELEIENAYAVAAMGTDILVFSGESTTTLTRLTGENRYCNASIAVNAFLDPDMPSVLVNEKGISYYDGESLVILGTNLKEIRRISLPEALVGAPVSSDDRSLIYYCTQDTLWEWDVETGFQRKIREISDSFSTAGSLLCNGTVVETRLGSGKQLFLDTQNGLTLGQEETPVTVTGHGEDWYARVEEGLLTVCVYGTGEEKRMLLPRDYRSDGWYLENAGYYLTASDTACYDLTTGERISQLEWDKRALDVAADMDGNLWVLTDGAMLYCWDPTGLPTGDDTVYSSLRYTLQNPDADGYQVVNAHVSQLEEKYPVTILYGEEALVVQDADFELTGEFMVPLLLEELEKLDSRLSVFPEDMLRAAVEGTTGGRLYICLVRQITGTPESGITDTVGGTQFWNGPDAYIALSVGQGSGQELYHQLYHVMETRMLSKSNACYEWDSLNPGGFSYDYSYVVNQSRVDEGWLEGNRYFIDLYSMSFPMEDRAQIFAYAMVEGNESYFESAAMQSKLLAICIGFREAYGLKKSPESFLWEQYLNTSLAYTK